MQLTDAASSFLPVLFLLIAQLLFVDLYRQEVFQGVVQPLVL